MNEIKLKVNFGKRTCVKSGISLTTGDYNSTKIKFEFDREDGTKIFEMKNPNNEIIFVDEIVNNEVILVGQADITTKHNDVIYIKYTDDNETIYWYDSELDKLYDISFVEVQNVSIDNLTKLTENASLFTMAGRYTFEISLYDGDSKLTSKSDYLDVKEEQVVINNNMVSLYLPVFDRLIGELDNLDIDVEKSGSTTTVTLNRKDGTSKTIQVLDGIDGVDGTDGEDGLTPTIGDNGDWYIGGIDTGKPSRGIQGETGKPGQDGTDGQDGHTPVKGVDYFTSEDIASLNIPAKTSQLQNDSGFLTNLTNNLVNYTLKTNTGSLIDLEINQTTYVVTLKLKDIDGNIISTDTIDLPLENVVVNGRYDNNTKKVILTLENGSEVDFSVADLVAGLQTEITSQNKLASDLVDDTNSGNKFVTTSEKQTWNNKLDSSSLTNYVQFSNYPSSSTAGVVKILSIYATAIDGQGRLISSTKNYNEYLNGNNNMFISKGTLENVITGKNLETANNKVTSISANSTDTQYPSAKCVYDYIQSLDGDEVSY